MTTDIYNYNNSNKTVYTSREMPNNTTRFTFHPTQHQICLRFLLLLSNKETILPYLEEITDLELLWLIMLDDMQQLDGEL